VSEGVGQLGNELQKIRHCLLGLFRAWFAQQEDFAAFRYDPDVPARSALFIGDQFPKGLEQSDWRPAIITRRSDFRWQAQGLGDDMIARDLARDIVDYTRLYTGGVVIHCVSAEGLEAERLAWIINDLLLLYWDQVRAQVPLFDWSGLVIGAEQPFELEGAETDWVDVPVNAKLQIQYNYRVEFPGTPLTEVESKIASS